MRTLNFRSEATYQILLARLLGAEGAKALSTEMWILSFSLNQLRRSVNMAQTRTLALKVVIIGDSGVGKTCISHRYLTGYFSSIFFD
jgi:DNA-binding NtrC family response regulator